jgi:hypothetical protein
LCVLLSSEFIRIQNIEIIVFWGKNNREVTKSKVGHNLVWFPWEAPFHGEEGRGGASNVVVVASTSWTF